MKFSLDKIFGPHSVEIPQQETNTFSEEDLSIIEDTSLGILSTLSFNEVLQNSIDRVVKRYRLRGGLLFLVEQNYLYARTISTNPAAEAFLRLIGKPVSDLHIEISPESKNYVVQTILTGNEHASKNLYDFTTGVLSERTTSTAALVTRTKSCIAIPIKYRDKTIGALFFSKSEDKDFSKESKLLNLIASQIGIAIVNSELFTDVKRQNEIVIERNKRLLAINKFTDTIISTLDPARVVQDALDSIPKLFGYLSAVYSIYDRKTNTIRIGGLSQNEVSKRAFQILGINPSEIVSDISDPKFSNGLAARAIKENSIQFSDSFADLTNNFVSEVISNQVEKLVGFKSVAVIPIKLKNEVVGVISFLFNNMTVEEVKVKELDTLIIITNQLTVGLENASLYVQVGQALEQLKLSNNQLKEKYQFEKDMMGIMGHELRTPMTIARGMSELLRSKADSADAVDKPYLKEKIDKIHTSIIKESDLIQTLLSASHIDNDKLNFSISSFNFADLVDFAVMTFKNDAKAKNLQLTFEKPAILSPMTSDQSRIQEVVSNLISNAIKYTNEGSITITIEEQNGFIYYRVKDTGIGIPKEEIPNIGKKFYRVGQHLNNNDNVVRAGGTGLGLYVVKGILDAIGGGLQIESEVGKGSTFTAIIPLVSKIAQAQGFTTAKPVEKGDMFQELGMKNNSVTQ